MDYAELEYMATLHRSIMGPLQSAELSERLLGTLMARFAEQITPDEWADILERCVRQIREAKS